MLNHQYTNSPSYFSGDSYPRFQSNVATDYGPNPFTININNAAMNNDTFRTALWTGNNLQLTLMSIPTGEEIGVEMHQTMINFCILNLVTGLSKWVGKWTI